MGGLRSGWQQYSCQIRGCQFATRTIPIVGRELCSCRWLGDSISPCGSKPVYYNVINTVPITKVLLWSWGRTWCLRIDLKLMTCSLSCYTIMRGDFVNWKPLYGTSFKIVWLLLYCVVASWLILFVFFHCFTFVYLCIPTSSPPNAVSPSLQVEIRVGIRVRIREESE